MHGMFQVHLGMKVRLTDSLSKELGLVKDAEGVVVHISAHPDDEEMVRRGIKEAEDGHEVRMYLTQMPLGLWLRMQKYEDTPQALQQAAVVDATVVEVLLNLELLALSFNCMVWIHRLQHLVRRLGPFSGICRERLNTDRF